jgi:hypothetical protein
MDHQPPGIWDAAECALLLIDYQDNVLAAVFEQDRRVIELNVCTIAKMARRLDIPVVLSTVGVELGASDPVLESLSAVLPDVEVIDRSHMNAWEDPAFVAAVKATGRKKLVMGGIVTSVCVAFPAQRTGGRSRSRFPRGCRGRWHQGGTRHRGDEARPSGRDSHDDTRDDGRVVPGLEVAARGARPRTLGSLS